MPQLTRKVKPSVYPRGCGLPRRLLNRATRGTPMRGVNQLRKLQQPTWWMPFTGARPTSRR
eukprot:5932578-Amphidinium_carterae.1